MSIGFPKPRPRVESRVQRSRERDKQAQDFRKAVWARDGGRCRHCDRVVIKSLELVPNRGEVHHRRGRNVAPEDRYNVKQAVLLCALCHAKAQRHEISILRGKGDRDVCTP